MSELHKFLFEDLPVRGVLVRLTDAWEEVLRRHATGHSAGAYPAPLVGLLGEMTAAAVLMQANVKFDGALVMQIFGDGPVKLAVAEVQSDLRLRATATRTGRVAPKAQMADMVNLHGKGRCAITLDPRNRQPGCQPYQGVVSLADAHGQRLGHVNEVLEHYMRQSQQLDTTLVLAADAEVAAGLLIQRLPAQGKDNLAAQAGTGQDPEALAEHYRRISTLARSLKRHELLTLDADTLLRRLFWQEKLRRFESRRHGNAPRFACNCSRERVAGMIRGLGQEETRKIVAERGRVEVGCDFCGQQYPFDAIDIARLFMAAGNLPPSSPAVQ